MSIADINKMPMTLTDGLRKITGKPVIFPQQQPTPRQLAKIIGVLVAEGGGEKETGMQAILNSIFNRIATNPDYYGNSVWNVISKPNQYSAFSVNNKTYRAILDNFDKKKALPPELIEPTETARNLFNKAITGGLEDITGGATHYYNPKTAIPQPWYDKLENVKDIGSHRFGYLYK